MTEQPSNEDFKKYEKLHYDKHIEYFKWMMGIAGTVRAVIVGVALSVTYATLKEYKEEVRKDMDAIKSDVKEMKNESIATMKETNQYFERQIPLIKAEAEAIALLEVRKSIAAEFEAKNIRELIEATAEQKFSGKLDKLVEAKIKATFDKIDEQTNITSELTYATHQVYFGDKKAWELLDSFRINHSTEAVRKMAENFQKIKRKDYEYAYRFYESETVPIEDVLWEKIHRDTFSKLSFESIIDTLTHTISKSDNLSEIASATVALIRITGIRFTLFDFDAIAKWKRSEYPKNIDRLREKYMKMKIKKE
jgi:hypothetical protein